MDFRIADTFTSSLTKLNGREQKAVKTTAFDLQVHPANPGMQFHKLDKPKDPNFWSVRVNKDIRIIVHRTEGSLMLCYTGHHDDAYAWGERRRIERHPTTGAAQLVEVRERIEEFVVRQPVEAPEPPLEKPLLFGDVSDEDLSRYGVPPDWIDRVRQATEDTLFDLTEALPQEAAEALLDLATGETPPPPVVAGEDTDPFQHPDAQRRFRVLANVEELERALAFPWDKWTVFLHPTQREFVERSFNGPARIAGSAGTGKTIVALHRAAHLARQHPDSRILLTTFSEALSNALKVRVDRLVGNEPGVRERIEVRSMKGVGAAMYAPAAKRPRIATDADMQGIIDEAINEGQESRFSSRFLFTEWTEIVDAWQLRTWESYRDVPRLGRRTRIGGKQREAIWAIFEKVRARMDDLELMTWPAVFGRVTDRLREKGNQPYDFAVVDEAQDLSVAELRFLAALAGDRPVSLFFAGDLGQRIFQLPFSWKALGVDVRGRSHRLRINYRTSHQIRAQADRLLPSSMADVDGVVEDRRGTISVFNGPEPDVM